nr:polyprotein [Monilinia fructicola fusarivirus 2]
MESTKQLMCFAEEEIDRRDVYYYFNLDFVKQLMKNPDFYDFWDKLRKSETEWALVSLVARIYRFMGYPESFIYQFLAVPSIKERDEIMKKNKYLWVIIKISCYMIMLTLVLLLGIIAVCVYVIINGAFVTFLGGIILFFSSGTSLALGLLVFVVCNFIVYNTATMWFHILSSLSYGFLQNLRDMSSVDPRLPTFCGQMIKLFFHVVLGDEKLLKWQTFENTVAHCQYLLISFDQHNVGYKLIASIMLWLYTKAVRELIQKGFQAVKVFCLVTLSLFHVLIWANLSPHYWFQAAAWISRFVIMLPYRLSALMGALEGFIRNFDRWVVSFWTRRATVSAMADNVIWLDVSLPSRLRLYLKIFRVNVLTHVLTFCKRLGFLVVAYGVPINQFKFQAVLTAGAMDVTHYINELDPPQFIRNFRFGRSAQDVDETLKILRELGYPVEEDVHTQSPDTKIGNLESFKDWLLSGTNFITGIHPVSIFKGLEFQKVKDLAVPYKWSDSYVNVENELRATSRYFQNTSVSIPDFEKAVDSTYEIVKVIFEGSRITPFYSIYKNWKKNYNVGPFATSIKRPRTKTGHHVKMKRNEDISRFKNVRSYLKYWEKLYSNFPRMTSFANVFYKSEALGPRKWRVDRIRTVVSSYLPQYLWQMVISSAPNHNFKPLDTPIKIGMPLTGFWMTKLFERHSHFKWHYAGDMTDFDSVIVGKIQDAIAAIRKRGFSQHRQLATIEQMIDLNYEHVQKILLLTPSTGNIYKKGDGLTTGHASTSMDNSLATVFLYLSAWTVLTGRNASDFKYFNELSCYGDDHIISIHEMAPKDWTFHNIQNVMKGWGVTMRDEVEYITSTNLKTGLKANLRKRDPTDLHSLPFLSKYCRVPTAHDKQVWKQAFGDVPVPSLIVYHDPVSLLGKAAAGAKNKNVEYRMTRLKSYLMMTAFNHKEYQDIRSMMEVIVKKYPKLKGELASIPHYEHVVRKHMDPNTKPKDIDNPLLDDIVDGTVLYGQMSVLDYVHNYLSVIPDVLNPSIQRIGYSLVTHRIVQPLLEWPKELIKASNNVLTQGHFESLIRQTPYDFLVNHRAPSVVTNEATLLIRHWLFNLFNTASPSISIVALFDKLLVKIANLQFIMNGKVNTKVQAFSFPVWNTLLVMLLNYVNVPDVHFEYGEDEWFSLFGIVFSIVIPDIALGITRLTNVLIARVWHSLPPNFREVMFLTKRLKPGTKHLVQAGTGTGKSTTFVQYMYQHASSNWNKIIVVEPRSKVVIGLVQYMKSQGVPVSGATSGLQLDPRAPIWYVTAQEVLLHMDWLSSDNLFLIDEAHLNEPAYDVLNKIMDKRNDLVRVFLTATPNPGQHESMTTFTVVPIPKVYTTTEQTYPDYKLVVSNDRKRDNYWLKVYYNMVSNIVQSSSSKEKFLIFINDKADIDYFLTRLPGKGYGLSSSLEFDLNTECDYVVTTSVADVAITIPGVTHVISPNFKRSVEPISSTKQEPCFIPLDDATKHQRMGRTGRTNNGTFTLVKMEFDKIALNEDSTHQPLVTPSERSSPLQLANWVLEGLPLEVLYDAKPEVFNFRGVRNTKDPRVKKIIEELQQNIEKMGFQHQIDVRKDMNDAVKEDITINFSLGSYQSFTPNRDTSKSRPNMDRDTGYRLNMTNFNHELVSLICAKFAFGYERASNSLWR